jgi:hypothetical protein
MALAAPTDLAELTAMAEALPVPAAVENVVALKESLTADQQQALRAALDKHMPQLVAITKQLPAPDLTEAGAEPAISDAETDKAVLRVAKRLDQLQAKISADVKGILTPEQFAVFEAGLAPTRGMQEALMVVDPDAPDLYCTYCWYSANEAAYADYYMYVQYYYAYYCYYYCGSTYSYYAYVYAYNAYVYYSFDGLIEISTGYFDCRVWGSDRHRGIYYSVSDLYNAYYYSHYAAIYAYYAYYYGCTSYCYYSYYYGWNYARSNLWDAYYGAWYGYNT